RFEVVVTDRYHGTIFALAAGTPVVIIKTNDHKVVTGADWFKGIYDEYIYIANDLDDAFQIVLSIRKKHLDYRLQPVFVAKYYDKLKAIFESEKNEF
ncbi:polysaccharide pyruvyl transferase family protein, partial [Lysinibacillus capsici]|uniref:polysaccharide pyruvyl transferase family protein n=1 Tax=Lysinibacillus capsici TaxID=2115968 RepID=UPI002A7F95EF